MSNTLVPTLSADKVELIKRQIAKDATDDELALFLHYCQSQGFDPLAKDVYFTKRTNHKTGKATTAYVTSIDTYRARAEETGQYAGNDDPVFDNEDKPSRATVTVYKLVDGVRCAFQASARWSQYYPGDTQGFMWNKMPHLMLGKCAEALALRKAFPKQFKKLYVREEMAQAGEEPDEKLIEPKIPVKEALNRDLHGELKKSAATAYDPQDQDDLKKLQDYLSRNNIEPELQPTIEERFRNKPWYRLPAIVREVTGRE